MQLPSSASKGTTELGSNIWLLLILLKRGDRMDYLPWYIIKMHIFNKIFKYVIFFKNYS